MTDLQTRTEINASTSRVWSILSDLDRYQEWNPFIRAADGQLTAGAAIGLVVAPPDRDPATVQVTVERVVPVASATVRHTCPEDPGRVTSHEYRLEPTRTGAVLHQVHRVVSQGDGPPDPVDDRTALGIDMMSAALKARAER